MIDPGNVSAVLVTRGDQDLQEIYDSIAAAGIEDVVTWNNAERNDVACYGRYLAIDEARHDTILFQDDDLVSPIGALLAQYDPGLDRWAVVANNRIDEEWPLLGIGSLFNREMADCFGHYIDLYGEDDILYRACDVVFAYQWPYRRVVLGYENLPWHSAPGASMYLQPDHMAVRLLARERTLGNTAVAVT